VPEKVFDVTAAPRKTVSALDFNEFPIIDKGTSAVRDNTTVLQNLLSSVHLNIHYVETGLGFGERE
jgi:hypothetical protein